MILVAQDVPRKQWMTIEGARAAVDAEWKRLKDKNTWRIPQTAGEVQFLSDVIKDAKKSGKGIHIGRLFDICVL